MNISQHRSRTSNIRLSYAVIPSCLTMAYLWKPSLACQRRSGKCSTCPFSSVCRSMKSADGTDAAAAQRATISEKPYSGTPSRKSKKGFLLFLRLAVAGAAYFELLMQIFTSPRIPAIPERYPLSHRRKNAYLPTSLLYLPIQPAVFRFLPNRSWKKCRKE